MEHLKTGLPVGIFNSNSRVDRLGNATVKVVFAGRLERADKITILARGLSEAQARFQEVPPAEWACPEPAEWDFSNITRWSDLIARNQLPYGEDSGFGSLQTSVWLPGYLGSAREVSEYVRKVNETLAEMFFAKEQTGRMPCPRCGRVPFDYEIASFSATGACRVSCGFRVHNFYLQLKRNFKPVRANTETASSGWSSPFQS